MGIVPSIDAFLTMLRTLLVILLVGRAAAAGNLCATDNNGDPDPSHELRELEKLAAGNVTADNLEYNEYCLNAVTKYKARILAACTKLVAKDPPYETCLVLAASLGEAKLGKRDIFDWIAHLPRGPWEVNSSLPDYPLYLFQQLGDPRGAALIIATWKDSLAKAAKHEQDHAWMDDWSGGVGAGAGGGAADEQAFLEAQAKATVDVHVRDACLDAAKAIAKRLAAKP